MRDRGMADGAEAWALRSGRRGILAALAVGAVPLLLQFPAPGASLTLAAAAPKGSPRRVTGNSPWRRLGNTTLAEYQREFARLRSPMLNQTEGIHRRVEGLSRLYLAMSYMEKKHDTFTETIPRSFRNALAVKRGDGSGRWER